MVIFGQLTDDFIDQAISLKFVSNNTDTASGCIATTYNFSTAEATVVAETMVITDGFVNCNAEYNFSGTSTTLKDLIPECFGQGRKCLGSSRFNDKIKKQCYIIIGIAVAILFLSGLQSLFFQAVAERQVYLIRWNFYHAILRQDIGWFDKNPSGELSSRLSE